MKNFIFLFLILLLSGCYFESERSSLAKLDDYQRPDDATLIADVEQSLTGLSFDEFIDQSYLYVSNMSDENAIAAGFADTFTPDNVNLTDASDQHQMQVYLVWAKISEMLSTYDKSILSAKQQLSYDIYWQFLQYQATASEYIEYSYPATYFLTGWPAQTESFFTQVFVLDSEHDVEIYLALLGQIERRMAQIHTALDTRTDLGIIEPNFMITISSDRLIQLSEAATKNTSYYQALETQLASISGLTAQQKETYLSQAETIIKQRVQPAYEALGLKLQNLISRAPHGIGVGQFSGGDDFYQSRLAFFTSSDMTPSEIHKLGLYHLDLIHEQMREIFTQLGYPLSESLSQSYQRVAADAGIIRANQVKATYEELIQQAYSNSLSAFSKVPQQEVVVIGGPTGGYYIRGTDDGTRPGAFYANTATDQPYTTMPTLAYHEAIPGHHFQIALASEAELPLIQRKYGFTAYVEGWALYAERLAKDLGWYDNDVYGDLGRLQFEAMRAARLVIDTGIHATGWTRKQADIFHFENVGFNGDIERYSLWPGQGTAYSAGLLKILAMRELAERELGDDFDLKWFHDVILNNGSMPLNILEQHVLRQIAIKQTLD